ncbi:hypothetical protein DU478_17200 [Thalassococcus profundi]|uniref:Nuclear transport factor 2 family protein n=1 Tax=Thalassococcus profundi TaxID=2282382 RepID=A0A369TI77_9RHOB|nr:hypothetical protein [Thalassococcus profundi]RDD64940.1 hypothetical protein DU478_17200 [Thalassococcus profundi]
MTAAPFSQIFQDWLDAVGDAMLKGDYARFASHIALPLKIRTKTTEMQIGSDADLRMGFDAWDAMLKAQNATDMNRRAHDAQMTGDGLLIGLYSTRILRGTVPVVPVFESTAALRRVGTEWRAIALESGVQNRQWPFDLPRIAEPADTGIRDASLPDEAE